MIKVLVIAALLCFFPALHAQDRVAFDTLYQRVNNLPSAEIIRLADDYLKKSFEDTAIVLYSIAYSRYNNEMSEKEKLVCALGYHKTANIYFIQGNYINALDFYIKGLKICESCRDKRLLPQFYLSLGNVYCTFQDYEKGINCYTKAYDLCRTYPNNQYEYNLLTNLAGAYSYLKDVDRAFYYNQKASDMTRPGDTVRNFMNRLNEGLILANERKYDDAIRLFRWTAGYAGSRRMEPRYQCSSYEELAKTFRMSGNLDSALYYLQKCNRIAENHKLADITIRCLKMFSEIYEGQGQRTKSLDFKGRYLSKTDSIFNVREFNRIKNSQYIYEMEKVGSEISGLNLEKEKKEEKIKIQQKALGGILIGLLAITGLLFWVYRQKRKLSKAYKNIFQANREMMASDSLNKSFRQQYEEELRIAHEELDRLKQLQGIHTGEAQEPEEPADLTKRPKYQASNLTEIQKKQLLASINRVMETTKEFCEEDFSLDKLASLVNSNSKYVSQVINESYGKNFNPFINEYRIKEARIRLADVEKYGNYTIKGIAESVGYKSHATFVNAFRSITGIMPSIFQKLAKEERTI